MSAAAITSSKDAMEKLKKRSDDKSVSQAVTYLLALLSKPGGASTEFDEDKSKQLLAIVASALDWFGEKSPVTAAHCGEIARLVGVMRLLPRAYDHLPTTFPLSSDHVQQHQHFFHHKFTAYTSMNEPSALKLALVRLYARLRSSPQLKPATKKWLDDQMKDAPPASSSSKDKKTKVAATAATSSMLPAQLINACKDLASAAASPAPQVDVALDYLCAMHHLALDLSSAQPPLAFSPQLLAEFPFFPFAGKLVQAVKRPGEHAQQLMQQLNTLLLVWRRVSGAGASSQQQLADEESAFAQQLQPSLQTLSVEEVRFLTNWCHNSRRSARVLLDCKCHVMACTVLRDANYDNVPMLEACLALLVNLARKQPGAQHDKLVAAGVGEIVLALVLKDHAPALVHQSLALVINMCASDKARVAFLQAGVPNVVCFNVLPKYATAKQDNSSPSSSLSLETKLVVEMSLGALWGLVVKFDSAGGEVNGAFLKQWLEQVYTAVTKYGKHNAGIAHRGLGALILMFTLNRDQQQLTNRLKTSFPEYKIELHGILPAADHKGFLSSDIDLFIQVVQ